ncbi:hypothetical protein [Terracidiphilus sp.]|uniref:hypothetical protein n=1 Tax=Terracidiphilus sp. TaxID=1964191 RepID=UPI003C1B9E05
MARVRYAWREQRRYAVCVDVLKAVQPVRWSFVDGALLGLMHWLFYAVVPRIEHEHKNNARGDGQSDRPRKPAAACGLRLACAGGEICEDAGF